ncbi:MAG: MBL fold metallo-hydrolase [Clostridia bacterium]|nr:MBL fold metallo-hydrolase [Clostridia bacterium]
MGKRRKMKKMEPRQIVAAVVLFLVALAGAGYLWLYGFFNMEDIAVYDDSMPGIFFLDVGQADSILVKSPTGEHMLIDAGKNDGADDLIKTLKDYGVDDIDYLILTHPHEDHVGGADTVFEHFEVKNVISPDIGADSKTWRDVVDAIEAEGCMDITASVGATYTLFEGCKFEILGPVDADTDLNNASIVLRLDYYESSFLFTGDAEKEAEEAILARVGKEKLDVDVLKSGHHGSSTSSSEEFLSAVTPNYAVISCGKDNSYGHPHEETLEKYSSRGIITYRTDKEGTVILQSDGESLYRVSSDPSTPFEKILNSIFG